MNIRTLLLPLIALISLSCKQSTTVEPPAITVSTYPFTAGIQWNYQAQASLINIRGLVPGTIVNDTPIVWNATVMVDKDTLLHDSIAVTKFVAEESLNTYTRFEKYYQVQNDTLRPVAWSFYSSIAIAPKRQPDYNRFAVEHSIASLQNILIGSNRMHTLPSRPTDTLYFTPLKPVLFVFPLQVGSEWNYLPHESSIGQIHKKVTAIEAVPLPAGNRFAYAIEWTWEMYPYISETEYIDATGIVKRTWLQKNIILTTAANPDSAGIADLQLVYVLTSSNLTP